MRAKVAKELRMVVAAHLVLEDAHDGYGDINSDYSVLDKQGAINTRNFDGVIDCLALKPRAPTLADLSRALARNARRLKPAKRPLLQNSL